MGVKDGKSMYVSIQEHRNSLYSLGLCVRSDLFSTMTKSDAWAAY